MRVLIIDTCYPAFLTSHYAQRPGLADVSYEGQWQALMDRFFGTSDAYSHFLGKLGHSAHELVVNCQPLQQAWARENGVRPRNRRLAPGRSLVLAQVEAFRPDVVYLQDLNALSRRTLRTLRKQSLLVVGQIASKPPSRPQLVGFDLLLTSFPHYVERFRNLGIESEYFRIGFDPRVLEHVASEPQSAEVVFVGGLARGPHAHGNELLERVARRTPVEFWGYKANLWPPDSAIRRAYRGEAWGLDMFRVLARSKIALNRHIDVAENHANNMRLYEATGVGTLLITDAKSNLSELFEPGEEVVTYVNEDELVEKISHYLDDESDRNRVARAGHERTLRDHTYEARMRELIAILTRHMK
jgi:spore maturation protein CgeB